MSSAPFITPTTFFTSGRVQRLNAAELGLPVFASTTELIAEVPNLQEVEPVIEIINDEVAAATYTEPSQNDVETEDIEDDPLDPDASTSGQPFDPKKIQVSIQQLTLDSIVKRIKHEV